MVCDVIIENMVYMNVSVLVITPTSNSLNKVYAVSVMVPYCLLYIQEPTQWVLIYQII